MMATYRTPSVVPGKERLEGHNAVFIRLLDAAQEGVVQVGAVVGVAIAVRNNTRINSSAVAMPNLEEGFRHRLAGVDVDDLYVQRKRYTFLTLGHVLANKLSLDPIRTLSHLGGEDAAVVARKEGAGVRVDGDASQVALVIGGEDAVDITGTDVGLLYWIVSLILANSTCLRTSVDGPFGSRLLDLSRAALMHCNIVTTLLERACTIRKRALVRVQVCSTLGNFLRMLLSALPWMSERLLREQNGTDDVREPHDE
jgi:hypothetical protein